MPLHLQWPEIALRLALAFAAAWVIGRDRTDTGEAAGLRTTMLVCLAATVSMIQANLLLVTDGKTGSSFSVLDLMRLPLGILTGMGFIGAGAILKRGNRVLGVTTAATLWFATVMGLCFGGGQIALGLVCVALCYFILTILKRYEQRSERRQRGMLYLSLAKNGPEWPEIEKLIRETGARTIAYGVSERRQEGRSAFEIVVEWRARVSDPEPPPFLDLLRAEPATIALKWLPDRVCSYRGDAEAEKSD